MSEQNKPVEVFRAGGVKASIWLNTTDGGKKFFSTSIVRSYYDEGAKQWKDTVSFGRDDLPKVRLVSDQAYEFIFARSQELAAEEQQTGFTGDLEKERGAKGPRKGGKAKAAANAK